MVAQCRLCRAKSYCFSYARVCAFQLVHIWNCFVTIAQLQFHCTPTFTRFADSEHCDKLHLNKSHTWTEAPAKCWKLAHKPQLLHSTLRYMDVHFDWLVPKTFMFQNPLPPPPSLLPSHQQQQQSKTHINLLFCLLEWSFFFFFKHVHHLSRSVMTDDFCKGRQSDWKCLMLGWL